MNLKSIPVCKGLPLAGNAIPISKDFSKFKKHAYLQYGPVVEVRFFFYKTVMLSSSAAAEFIYLDKDEKFSSKDAWSIYFSQLFDNGLLMRDFQDHRFHRRVLQKAFKSERLDDYLLIMQKPIMDAINRFSFDVNEVNIYPEMKKLSLQIASQTILGFTDKPAWVDLAITELFSPVFSVIRRPFPFTNFRKALKARKKLEQYLSALIDQKQIGARGVLPALCQAMDEDHITKHDVIDHAIFLILASHDTVASAISNIIFYLGKESGYQDRLYGELGTINPGDYQGILANDLLDCFIKEVLRLHPPVVGSPRVVTDECTLMGYRVPKNTRVSIDIETLHRDPGYWKEPDKFEPERFITPREEKNSEANRFYYIPFGGGVHACIGKHFAIMEMKSIVYQLLTQFRISLKPGYQLKTRQLPVPVPVDNLPVILKRRSPRGQEE